MAPDTRPALQHFTGAAVAAEPDAVARQVVAALATKDATIAVHFDVDAVDSRDLPLANFPHYGTGVPLVSAGLVLELLLAAPGASALVLTEVNPTHDPTGTQLDRYVETVTGALARALLR